MTKVPAVLTERDTQVLLEIYRHRYLSVSQICRLSFPSMQTAYRRLRALLTMQLIAGFTVPGVTEHIYYLTRAGAEAVSSTLGVDVDDLKWHQISRPPKDYYFVRHFLAVNDFRISLGLGLKGSELRFLGFIPEYYGRKSTNGTMLKYIRDVVCDIGREQEDVSHTPDAVFALGKGQSQALFFLEIDRGTEVVSNEEIGVLKAVRFYLNYLLSGQYQKYSQDFSCGDFKGFRALLVTTSSARVHNIRRAITDLAFDDKAKKFIWLTTSSQLETAGVFDRIWLSADARDETLYQIA